MTSRKVKPGLFARKRASRNRADGAPEGFISRRKLQEQLGLTLEQLRSLVRLRVIRADRQNSGGYGVFSHATVERLRLMKSNGSLFPVDAPAPRAPNLSSAQYTAAEGVLVFELLDGRQSLKDIVLSTKIHPVLVKLICADYNDLAGSIILFKEDVDRINGHTSLPGSFPVRSAEGLLEVVSECATLRQCSTEGCNQEAACCMNCVVRVRRSMRHASRDVETAIAHATHDEDATRDKASAYATRDEASSPQPDAGHGACDEFGGEDFPIAPTDR